ncbi:MAG: 16S rRNA (cytosine(1402)-N(4))-methyltransferase RsmH [Patescibacteria group bacterium]|nr:16S rRNA (cytosine(1402)-N(4))-methyltransferase RsmH [Patescibacteria group bacterium]
MHQNKHQNAPLHVPVLLQEVLQYLAPAPGNSYLDLTAGYGGHASEVLARTNAPQRTTLVDRDDNAISVLKGQFVDGERLIHADFLTASIELSAEGSQYDLILADLGVSSPHLNDAHRGFMFSEDGPLDMRMDQQQALTASEIVNHWDEATIAAILKRYSEEPKAKRIASLITAARPIHSTAQLADIVKQAWPGHSRVHPATRTFQALRIAVNDELGLLERSLPLWLDMLAPGGRIAIISFHSLEDRIVKQILATASGDRYDAELQLLTKRPVVASPHELVTNPRARSAKLRAAVKK